MSKVIDFITDSSDFYIMKDNDGFTRLYLYEFIELLAEPHDCKYDIAYVNFFDCDLTEEVEGLENTSSEYDIFWDFVEVINPNQIDEADKNLNIFGISFMKECKGNDKF